MDLTLDQLLGALQDGMDKVAADESKEEKKEDSADEGKEKKMPPWLKDKKDEKSESKDEKSEDKDEKSKDKEDGQEKSASEAGAALAREIMEKVASINLETTEMNKQAQTAGQALASALLANLQKSASEKKASAGDMTVMDGGAAPGAVANKVQNDVVQAEGEGAAAIKPMLTGDGVKNTGTINEIFDAMVADALSQGAASEEQVHDVGVAKEEGAVEAHAVPNQVKVASAKEDEIEKAAAISELVAQGIDFADAVTLVKQAAADIELEMEKAAAMNQLMAEGVDFESAVELVKKASAGDMTVMDGGAAPGAVANKVQNDVVQAEAEGAASIKPMLTGDGVKNTGTINQIFDAIVADAKGQGAASEDQVHDTGVAKEEGKVEEHAVPSQVKVAAIERMVAAGVDFDKAVDFVKEAGVQAALEAGARGVGKTLGMAKGFAGAAGKKVAGGVASMSKTQQAVAGGALAAGAVGGAALAMRNREKKAAFDALIEAGVDFDNAAVLVSQKAVELYGK